MYTDIRLLTDRISITCRVTFKNDYNLKGYHILILLFLEKIPKIIKKISNFLNIKLSTLYK